MIKPTQESGFGRPQELLSNANTVLDLAKRTLAFGSVSFDFRFRHFIVDEWASILHGLPPKARLRDFLSRFSPEDRRALFDRIVSSRAKGTAWCMTCAIEIESQTRNLSIQGRAYFRDGRPAGVVMIVIDSSAHNLNAVAASEPCPVQALRLSATEKLANQAIIHLSHEYHITDINDTCEKLLGVNDSQLRGFQFSQLIKDFSVVTHEEIINLKFLRGQIITLHTDIIRSDKSTVLVDIVACPLHDEKGIFHGAVLRLTPSNARLRFEETQRRRAQYDGLTELPNRRLFLAWLDKTLSKAAGCSTIGVIHLGILGFTRINDAYGPDVGDQCLVALSLRLKALSIKGGHILGRINGDEFAIIAQYLPSAAAIEALANEVLNACKAYFTVHGLKLHLPVSVGYAVSPDDSKLAYDIMRYARLGYERSRKGGGISAQRLSLEDFDRDTQVMALTTSIGRAIDTNQFEVKAAPLWDLTTQKLYGLHLSAVWQHSTLGELLSRDFYEALARSQRSYEFAAKMLDRGFSAIRVLAGMNSIARDLKFFINAEFFPAHGDLAVLDFPKHMDTLNELGMKPEQFVFSINSDILPDDDRPDTPVFSALRDAGFNMAYVAGMNTPLAATSVRYAELSHVRIDRGMLADASSDSRIRAFCSGLIDVCKALGKPALTTDIDSREILEATGHLHVDIGGGSAIAPPISINQMGANLSSLKPPAKQSRSPR